MRLYVCKKIDIDSTVLHNYYFKNKVYHDDELVKSTFTLDIGKILGVKDVWSIEKPVNIEELLPTDLKNKLTLDNKFVGYNLFEYNGDAYLPLEDLIKFDYFIPELSGYLKLLADSAENLRLILEPMINNKIISIQYGKHKDKYANYNEFMGAVKEMFEKYSEIIIYGE